MLKNILVTSIGSFSGRCVIESLRENKAVNKIIGCDIFPAEWHNISILFNKVYLAPLIEDEKNYFNFISQLCTKHKIDVIIPLTDLDVDFFLKHRPSFQEKDLAIAIGNDSFLTIARNKLKLNEFLKKNNYDFIQSYTVDQLEQANYPLIGKPFNGRSSEGIVRINSIEKTISEKENYKNYIFQEIIEGSVYTIDIVRSSHTKEIVSIPRKELLRTLSGAGMTVELVEDKKLMH